MSKRLDCCATKLPATQLGRYLVEFISIVAQHAGKYKLTATPKIRIETCHGRAAPNFQNEIFKKISYFRIAEVRCGLIGKNSRYQEIMIFRPQVAAVRQVNDLGELILCLTKPLLAIITNLVMSIKVQFPTNVMSIAHKIVVCVGPRNGYRVLHDPFYICEFVVIIGV